jgi:hypothetical protein
VTKTPEGQTIPKTAKEEFFAEQLKPKKPDDFTTELDFLTYAIKLFDLDLWHDRKNREQAIDDSKFMAGEQWDVSDLNRRRTDGRPSLVFNRLPAFVAQLVGNRRLNQTDIKVVADDSNYKKTAEIREGLVRNIQKVSRADVAFNKALENQVIAGIGNFELALEYSNDDVFEQDIKIKSIPNAMAVVWDRDSVEPDGIDAHHVFKQKEMDITEFQLAYPDAKSTADMTTDTQLMGVANLPDWISDSRVRIVEFWRMRSHKRTLALLTSTAAEEGGKPGQDVEDVTDMEFEDFKERLVMDGNGLPIMREVDRPYAQMYIITALDILEGPYDLPISRVPVYRVPGWDVNVGESRVRFGLIRFLKDPQRLHNFWRSTIAEKLQLTPKSTWVADEASVQGREQQWRDSHLSQDPLLTYNGEAGPAPERVAPAQLEPALINEAGMASQDLRDISNLHEASMGQQSNEVSGKAIMARQRVGETGTVIYQDNLDLAIGACGTTINQLIPFVYNTARVIKILGEDGEDIDPVQINDETDENSVDITTGKYSVSTTTGPSYVTKRIEAAEGMLNMVNAMPDTMAAAADEIIEAQDWPKARKIANRIRSQMDPSILGKNDISDEQRAQMEGQAQAAQQQKEVEQIMLATDIGLKRAQTAQANANATKAEADAAASFANVNINEFKVVADVESNRVKSVLEAMDKFNTMATPETEEEQVNGG